MALLTQQGFCPPIGQKVTDQWGHRQAKIKVTFDLKSINLKSTYEPKKANLSRKAIFYFFTFGCPLKMTFSTKQAS